jgi:hypothetical protein
MNVCICELSSKEFTDVVVRSVLRVSARHNYGARFAVENTVRYTTKALLLLRQVDTQS